MKPSEERVSSTHKNTDYVCKNCWWVFNKYPDDMNEEFQRGGSNEIECKRCGGELIRIPYRMKDDWRKRYFVDPRPSLKTPPKSLDEIQLKGWKERERIKKQEDAIANQ